MENHMSAIDKLFDENNNDNIVLYNENGEATEFEQVAIIPHSGKIYVLLSLASPTEDISDDEGFVFSIETSEEGKKTLSLVTDDGVIDGVFKIYEDLLDELEESDDFFDDEPEDLLDEILADLDDEE